MDFKTLKEYCNLEGYKFWADNAPYNIFLYGIRNTKGKVNLYDDILGMAYLDNLGNERVIEDTGTTDPGSYFLKNNLGHPEGTAILCPGQYRGCWEVGKHGKYRQAALVQSKEASFKVWRDRNKDGLLDCKGKIYDNVTGLNCHTRRNADKDKPFKTAFVDSWSAGCQVRKALIEHHNFMSICKISAKIFGNKFSYTLFEKPL